MAEGVIADNFFEAARWFTALSEQGNNNAQI